MWATERLSDALEQVVGLAIVDPDFANELLEDAATAIRRHDVLLSPVEHQLLCQQTAHDLPGLARGLLQGWRELAGDPALLVAGASIARMQRKATESAEARPLPRVAYGA